LELLKNFVRESEKNNALGQVQYNLSKLLQAGTTTWSCGLSDHFVLTKLAWFGPLCDVVRQAASTGYPKVYGGCFGCQLISHALGGQVDYNPNKVFFLKAESVQVNLDLIHKYVRNANENDVQASFNVIESHGDCVAVLPPDADRIGTSSSCTNEIFVTGAHRNILACQGHPEFDLQYSVYERIWPEAVDRMHRLNEDEAREYKKTFECYTGEDALRLRRLIAAFLHS
jgi:GMP synthase-like glutamine amidotransferase